MGFKGRACSVSPCYSCPWFTIAEVNYNNRGLNVENTFCTLCLRGWGFHAKPVYFLKIFNGDLYFDTLIIGLFQIFLVMGQLVGKEHFKRGFWMCRGRGGELVRPDGQVNSFTWGNWGGKKLRMVPCHSCHTIILGQASKQRAFLWAGLNSLDTMKLISHTYWFQYQISKP